MEEPLMKPVQLYDMSNTLIVDCEIPVSEHAIELITLPGGRYFVFDSLTGKYKEGMRYHVSQMNH